MKTSASSNLHQWLGIGCLALLGAAIFLSGRIGLSRLLSEYAIVMDSVPMAKSAIRFSPSDSQAHFACAVALTNQNQPTESIVEFERAAQLKPTDYYLWLRLGRALDWAQQEERAQKAFSAAIQLAPYYAAPRWELGNLLLRAGKEEEAFLELRAAARSNRLLLPAIIDLAWNTFAGDTGKIQSALQPEAPDVRLALARYYYKQGKLDETLAVIETLSDEIGEAERRKMLSELFSQGNYHKAHQVWLRRTENKSNLRANNSSLLTDGSFEGTLKLEKEPWFGWDLGAEARTDVKASLDLNQPQTGLRSLQLDWSGEPPPASSILSQLVIVEPGSNYRLKFAVRTANLMSGGMPYFVIVEKSEGTPALLGQSTLLPRETDGWQTYKIDFSVPSETTAILILLRRQCQTSPCPIYGRMWLDNFLLEKL